MRLHLPVAMGSYAVMLIIAATAATNPAADALLLPLSVLAFTLLSLRET